MGFSSGSQDDLNSEINITPFVDVMLVLLVVFMIAAPMLKKGVDIQLPAVEAPAQAPSKDDLVLRIDSQQKLYLGPSQLRWQDLKQKLGTNELIQRTSTLHVEAHADIPYRIVVSAMALARNAGVQKVILVTDPNAPITASELDKMAKDTTP